MFKILFLLLTSISSIGAFNINNNVSSQVENLNVHNVIVNRRNNKIIEDVEDATITYKYETNDVNSIDDLIDGNIYKMSISRYTLETSFLRPITVYALYNIPSFNGSFDLSCEGLTDYLIVELRDNNQINFRNSNYSNVANLIFDTNTSFPITFDFVYRKNINVEDFDFISISSTDFNVIESIEYTTPTTIFGYIAQVLGNNIFGGIPNVDNVIFTIGGQNITLKSWLVTTTCVILASILIFAFVLLFRWLIKLFSNSTLFR